MKTLHRFCLGLVSSLLFAVGLNGAASRLDPVTREHSVQQNAVSSISPDCVAICTLLEDESR